MTWRASCRRTAFPARQRCDVGGREWIGAGRPEAMGASGLARIGITLLICRTTSRSNLPICLAWLRGPEPPEGPIERLTPWQRRAGFGTRR